MKFEKGIAKKYRQSIEDAFQVISEKGNEFQQFMIKQIIESKMLVCVYPVSKVNASGITGVINPEKTNDKILSERLGLQESFGECFITIAEETIDTGFQRGCEGTFVHEGRHAFDFAQSIESLSKADINPLSVFNPTLYELEWEAHLTSAEYMLQINKDEYLQEGLDLMILGKNKDKFFVDEEGIRRRLAQSYGLKLNENLGPRITEMVGLKSR